MSDVNTATADHSHASHMLALYAITAVGFIMSWICFYWSYTTDEVAILLLGWVTFGMSCDFLNHILGAHFADRKKFLEWYSRFNFSALCFGIPFTAYAGTFVLAEVIPGGISATLVNYWQEVLIGSLLFGSLFMVAKYKEVEINGAVEFVLDKSHGYTKFIFITRRVLLLISLIIGLTVVADGFGTDWFLWSLAFTGIFVASVPLHILHKQIPSMLSEVGTQAVAMAGTYVVFVA